MGIWEDVEKSIKEIDKSFKKKVGDPRLPYAGLMAAVAQGLRMTSASTTTAFRQGDTMGGVGGILGMIGSLSPLLGLGGMTFGTVGGIVAMLFDIIGSVIAGLGPRSKSLRQEIEEALDHLHAQLIHDELVGALRDLERAQTPLSLVTNGTRTWEAMQSGFINMLEGNAAHQLGVTKSWLEKAENQENPEWTLIYESYWFVVALRAQVFVTIVTKLISSDNNDAHPIGTAAILERYKRDRVFAKALYDVALNKGTLWHIGYHGIYAREGVITGKQADYTSLDTDGDRLAVGPLSRNLYVLQNKDKQVVVRDDPSDPKKWRSCFLMEVQGADLWAMPLPPDHSAVSKITTAQADAEAAGRDDEDLVIPPPPERIVVVAQDGKALYWTLSDAPAQRTIWLTKGTVQQFRSMQRADGTARYFMLGKTEGASTTGIGYKVESLSSDPFNVSPWELDGTFVEPSVSGGLLGLAVGKDPDGKGMLVVHDARSLWIRRFEATQLQEDWQAELKDGWTLVARPAGEGGNINHVSAGRDGLVLVIFGDKLWGYVPTTVKSVSGRKQIEYQWKKENAGEMARAVHAPVRGFDIQNGCRTTVTEADGARAAPAEAAFVDTSGSKKLEFADVYIPGHKTMVISLRNTTSTPLPWPVLRLSGVHAAQFTVLGGVSAEPIQPNETGKRWIRFDPSTKGKAEAKLLVGSPTILEIALTGNGLPPPAK